MNPGQAEFSVHDIAASFREIAAQNGVDDILLIALSREEGTATINGNHLRILTQLAEMIRLHFPEEAKRLLVHHIYEMNPDAAAVEPGERIH